MTIGNSGHEVTPVHPLDATVLSDYWLGLLSPADEEAVEMHLLECDDCGATLREVMAIAEGVRTLAQQGSLRMVITETLASRVAESGRRIRRYAATPGQTVHCTVTADDDLLISRLAADLRGAARIDMSFVDQDDVERHRLNDIPFNAESGGLLLQESITFAKAAPSAVMRFRLLAIEDAGSERLIGEYTFSHTRSLPGPGSW